jgi:hypothetical protein
MTHFMILSPFHFRDFHWLKWVFSRLYQRRSERGLRRRGELKHKSFHVPYPIFLFNPLPSSFFAFSFPLTVNRLHVRTVSRPNSMSQYRGFSRYYPASESWCTHHIVPLQLPSPGILGSSLFLCHTLFSVLLTCWWILYITSSPLE